MINEVINQNKQTADVDGVQQTIGNQGIKNYARSSAAKVKCTISSGKITVIFNSNITSTTISPGTGNGSSCSANGVTSINVTGLEDGSKFKLSTTA